MAYPSGVLLDNLPNLLSAISPLELGTPSSVAATTLTDTQKSWPTNVWDNHGVAIVKGTGLGQLRRITENTATVLTIGAAWTTNPDASSVYVIIQLPTTTGPHVLASRSALAAVDGAPVNGTAFIIKGLALYVEFIYTVTGGPATLNVRCAIETSVDGNSWHQLIRFVDQTAVGGATRVGRVGQGATAGAEAALAASDLTAAAGAAVVSDGAIGNQIRAVTMLQAMTGGTSPTVTITVRASVA